MGGEAVPESVDRCPFCDVGFTHGPPLAIEGAVTWLSGTTASAQKVAIEAKGFVGPSDLPFFLILAQPLEKRSEVIAMKGCVGTAAGVRKEFSNPVHMIGNPLRGHQALLREKSSEVVHDNAI
jgi:hypothetical protein